MGRFMYFDEMITPKIIQFVFWIGVALHILGGLIGIFSLATQGVGSFLGALIIVPLIVIVGIVLLRIWCELMIVIFKIYESLTEIKNQNLGGEARLTGYNGAPPPAL